MKLSASAFRQQPIDARAADAGAFAISVAPQAPAPSRTWEASRRAISAPVFTSHSRIVLSRTALSASLPLDKFEEQAPAWRSHPHVSRRDAGALRGSARVDVRDRLRPWQQDAFVAPSKAQARRRRVGPCPPRHVRGSSYRFRRGTGNAPPLRRRLRWRRGIGLGAVTRRRWRGIRPKPDRMLQLIRLVRRMCSGAPHPCRSAPAGERTRRFCSTPCRTRFNNAKKTHGLDRGIGG
jgi:hypothetical protein